MELCNGKINLLGYCDRCGAKHETTSVLCVNFVEFSTASSTKENSAHSFTEGMDVPESEPSSKQGDGWISVKDRLPETAKQVCITLEMDGNAKAAKSYPGFRANGGWYVFTIPDKSWVPHDDKHYKITHWQALPPPPKKL